MVSLGDVATLLYKGGDGQLLLTFEICKLDGSRLLITKSVLEQLCLRYKGLQLRINGLYSALLVLNKAFVEHNYNGWRIATNGLVECHYLQVSCAASTFNNKLEDMNRYIEYSKLRPLAAHQPDYKGWICKQGRLVKNWKRRFMVLENCNLTYYDSDNITCTLSSKGNFQVVAITYDDQIENGIVVFGTSSRVFKFYTADRNSCIAWYEAISFQLNTTYTSSPLALLCKQSHTSSEPQPLNLHATSSLSAANFKVDGTLVRAQAILVFALKRTTKGELSLALKTPSGRAYRAITASEINEVYAVHAQLKLLADDLFAARKSLNEKLAKHKYKGWNMNAKGKISSSVLDTVAVVDRFNHAVEVIKKKLHFSCDADPIIGSAKAPSIGMSTQCAPSKPWYTTYGPLQLLNTLQARQSPADAQYNESHTHPLVGVKVEMDYVVEFIVEYEEDDDEEEEEEGNNNGNQEDTGEVDNGEFQGDTGVYESGHGEEYGDASGDNIFAGTDEIPDPTAVLDIAQGSDLLKSIGQAISNIDLSSMLNIFDFDSD